MTTEAVRPTLDDIRRAASIMATMGEGAVSQALNAIAQGEDPGIALGLRSRPGKRSALTADRNKRRDRIIRAWRQRQYKRVPIGQAVRDMMQRALRYQTTRAKFDEGKTEMPPGYSGLHDEFLFQLLQVGAPFPSKSWLHAILGAADNPVD